MVELAGVPPAKLHKYVNVEVPQLVEFTVGVVEAGLEQELVGEVLSVTMGGSFTVTD